MTVTAKKGPLHENVARYRLRSRDRGWLHMSGSGFTPEKRNGWIGHKEQVRKIRAISPDARECEVMDE